jgi:ABC-type branched-subunit amino acid transport system permease subunit
MSGYWLQILAILAVNIVAAYAAYMPLACGQLNLGIAGFMAIGAYASAVLSGQGWPLAISITAGTVAAGALYAHHFNYIEAQHFNVLLSTYALLYALLGGLQTPIGPLIGAALFTLAPEFLRVTDQWRYVGFGAAIILLMLVRPEGLLTRNLIRTMPLRFSGR